MFLATAIINGIVAVPVFITVMKIASLKEKVNRNFLFKQYIVTEYMHAFLIIIERYS